MLYYTYPGGDVISVFMYVCVFVHCSILVTLCPFCPNTHTSSADKALIGWSEIHHGNYAGELSESSAHCGEYTHTHITRTKRGCVIQWTFRTSEQPISALVLTAEELKMSKEIFCLRSIKGVRFSPSSGEIADCDQPTTPHPKQWTVCSSNQRRFLPPTSSVRN